MVRLPPAAELAAPRTRRPKLYALSPRAPVWPTLTSSIFSPRATHACWTCALRTVLCWGTPGGAVDGGGGRWSPLMVSCAAAACARSTLGACLMPCGLCAARAHQVRRAQKDCSEVLFQLRCASPKMQPRLAAGANAVWPHALRARASFSAVGKRSILAHSGCLDLLRHHARAVEDVDVGGRCRGALVAIEERRGAGASPSAAANAAGAGHLMISCASPPPYPHGGHGSSIESSDSVAVHMHDSVASLARPPKSSQQSKYEF